MEFWFSEFHTPDVKHSIRVNKQLYSKQSDYQRIDIFETPEFGRVLTLDGNEMCIRDSRHSVQKSRASSQVQRVERKLPSKLTVRPFFLASLSISMMRPRPVSYTHLNSIWMSYSSRRMS